MDGTDDEKARTAVSNTSLALFQIQLNAFLPLLERQAPTVPICEDFQRLVNEEAQAVGRERVKSRIREIIQQDIEGWALTRKAEWVVCCPSS